MYTQTVGRPTTVDTPTQDPPKVNTQPAPNSTPAKGPSEQPCADPPKGYKYHPAASIFPMMSSEQLAELGSDIKAVGQREPIERFEGEIIDGRNRLAACEIACAQPWIKDIEIKGSPTEYVVSRNLHRRHLTPGQRAAVAVEIAEQLGAEAKKRQTSTGSNGASGGRGNKAAETLGDESSPTQPKKEKAAQKEAAKSTTRAAKAAGAGVTATKKLAAVKKKDPTVFAAAKAGKLSVAEAARRTTGSTTKPVATPKRGTWTLHTGDMSAVRKMHVFNADLVVVDRRGGFKAPADSFPTATSLLMEGGSLLVLVDSDNLFGDTTLKISFGSLFPIAGPAKKNSASKVVSVWQYGVRFAKGDPKDWVRDDAGSGAGGLDDLIATLSTPGGTVVDLTCADESVANAVVAAGRKLVAIAADEASKLRIERALAKV